MSTFTFYYNQSGENRMPFARAVAEIIGVKPKYTGVPKCAYIIGFATVTRQGNIEVDDQTDRDKLAGLVQKLMEKGYVTEQSGAEWLTPAADGADDSPTVEDTVMPETPVEIPAATDSVETDAAESAEPSPLEEAGMTIAIPRDTLTEQGLENLKKLLWAKSDIICSALDIQSTEIEVEDDTISFPWFGNLTPDEIRYISQFIEGLCRFANNSRRITSKKRHEDNMKFAMRTWAIRLGFSGPEYKDLRKYLMQRLPGDAAWRYGRPEVETWTVHYPPKDSVGEAAGA